MAINAHELAPRTSQWLKERAWDRVRRAWRGLRRARIAHLQRDSRGVGPGHAGAKVVQSSESCPPKQTEVDLDILHATASHWRPHPLSSTPATLPGFPALPWSFRSWCRALLFVQGDPHAVGGRHASFIVFQGIIKGKGLQALVQILYQILDKTRNVIL